MKSKSLLEQAYRAQGVARRDWEAADAKIVAMTWNKRRYCAAVDARLEAARRWTEANMKVKRLEKHDETDTQ